MSDEDCKLCIEAKWEVGTIGERGAVIYRTGNDPDSDWQVTFQKNTYQDLDGSTAGGATFMLFPVGHIGSFSGINLPNGAYSNFGMVQAISYQSLAVLQYERGITDPLASMTCGKVISGRNTIPGHIHQKVVAPWGTLNQPLPTDTTLSRLSEKPETDSDGRQYIRISPIVKGTHPQDDYERYAARLTEVAAEIAEGKKLEEFLI